MAHCQRGVASSPRRAAGISLLAFFVAIATTLEVAVARDWGPGAGNDTKYYARCCEEIKDDASVVCPPNPYKDVVDPLICEEGGEGNFFPAVKNEHKWPRLCRGIPKNAPQRPDRSCAPSLSR